MVVSGRMVDLRNYEGWKWEVLNFIRTMKQPSVRCNQIVVETAKSEMT